MCRQITIWPSVLQGSTDGYVCDLPVVERRQGWGNEATRRLSRFRADTPQSSAGVKLGPPPSYHPLRCARKVGNLFLLVIYLYYYSLLEKQTFWDRIFFHELFNNVYNILIFKLGKSREVI